jgi:hypothetical protein
MAKRKSMKTIAGPYREPPVQGTKFGKKPNKRRSTKTIPSKG